MPIVSFLRESPVFLIHHFSPPVSYRQISICPGEVQTQPFCDPFRSPSLGGKSSQAFPSPSWISFVVLVIWLFVVMVASHLNAHQSPTRPVSPVPLYPGAVCLAPLEPHLGLQVLPFAHSMGGVLMPWAPLFCRPRAPSPLLLSSHLESQGNSQFRKSHQGFWS